MKVKANINDPDDFSTSSSRSDSEGHGSAIFRMSRRFPSNMAEKRDRKNVRMSTSELKSCRARQYVVLSVGDTENFARICSSTLLVKKKRRGSWWRRNARVTISIKSSIDFLSSHSSRASTMITMGRGGIDTDRIGLTINS